MREYIDYEDDETCLAPCKEREWYLNGWKDHERQVKHAWYCKRYREKKSNMNVTKKVAIK